MAATTRVRRLVDYGCAKFYVDCSSRLINVPYEPYEHRERIFAPLALPFRPYCPLPSSVFPSLRNTFDRFRAPPPPPPPAVLPNFIDLAAEDVM